ncbi:Replication factor A protein 1 [Orbilia brochopaga]|uniref:Replication protein A subunit n=1 Tax=Orbilia brochopaga TaxID=3140254 RepID=A0AAV9UDR4_9PEZI
MANLSGGCLAAIFAAGCENPKEAWKDPVLQVLLVKKIEAQGKSPERYRIVLSDGLHFTQGMVGTQINHIMAEGKIDKGCIIKLTEYGTGRVKDKSVLILLGVEMLEELGYPEKIGDPKQVTPESAAELAEQQRAAQPTSTTNFYGNKPSTVGRSAGAASAPSRAAGNSNGSRGGSSVAVSSIESLSPYHNRWTIKARCIQKSEVKRWKNQKGDGKLFAVTLMDQTGEIKATGFNDQCDAFYDVFQEGDVYYITKCKVQIAKKQFSNIDNDYELTFERDSEVQKAEDEDDVPMPKYNFVSLEGLQSTEKDALVDVIGVIKEIGDSATITSQKTQKSFTKREVSLVDDTGYNVKLTVWGKYAEKFEVPPESVVAFKGVKVSDFGGRSLSMMNSSTMQVDPDLEESHRLKGWFDGEGRDANFSSHEGLNRGAAAGGGKPSAYKTIQQATDENLGLSDTPDFYTLKATISYIKTENLSYAACKTEGCNKKVIELETGAWRCEKCNTSWPQPEWRYILTCSVYDHTGQSWLNIFDDAGKVIMGATAGDLHSMQEYDEQSYESTLKKAVAQTWIFRVRAKMDTYNDQQRVRNHVMSAHKPDYAAESHRMMEIINMYG